MDIEKKQTLSVRRDTGAKAPIPLADVNAAVPQLLETIQSDMFARAKAVYDSKRKVVTEWDDLVPTLDNKCVAVLPWCEEEVCEDDIKERSGQRWVIPTLFVFVDADLYVSAEPQDARAPSAGAKSLCIPFDQSTYPAIEPGKTKCPGCGKDSKRWTMFGRSY